MKRWTAIVSSAAVVTLGWPLSVPEAEGPPYQELPKTPLDVHPNRHAISRVPLSVGIIGGGLSGLVTTKVLKQQGYNVQVLEKRDSLGGVWYNNYEGAGLQVPYPTYDMPDHYFPKGTPFLPKQDLILKHFEDYVEKFGIRENLRFNIEVKDIRQLEDDRWEVTLADGSKLNYDFLVQCTGAYHTPKPIHFPGEESFQGKILHSSQVLNAKDICEGKHVVVIGGGKSAMDILQVAADHATSTTGLMRTIRWSIPSTFNKFGLHTGLLMYSRFAELLTAPAYCESGWIHWLLTPIGGLYWDYMGKKISEDLPPSAKPTTTFRQGREGQVSSRDSDFTGKVQSGRIAIRRGEIDHVLPDGIVTKTGEKLPADVLIYATGFKRNYFGLQEEGDNEQWRYRNIILPGVKNFATIGILDGVGAPLQVNLQAAWLAEMLRGKVVLPSVEEMKKDVEKRKTFLKKTVKSAKISFQMKDSANADQLLRDMGLQARRDKTWFSHWFLNTHPSAYRTVLTHRV